MIGTVYKNFQTGKAGRNLPLYSYENRIVDQSERESGLNKVQKNLIVHENPPGIAFRPERQKKANKVRPL
jgi:hypothetical protein